MTSSLNKAKWNRYKSRLHNSRNNKQRKYKLLLLSTSLFQFSELKN